MSDSHAVPFWADNSIDARQWDTVGLGKDFLPGICEVEASKGRDLDVKKAKGNDGYTMTDNGASAGKVTITMRLATREHWLQWQNIRPRIDPNRPGAKRVPLNIVHPQCLDRGISTVSILNIKAGRSRSGARAVVDLRSGACRGVHRE